MSNPAAVAQGDAIRARILAEIAAGCVTQRDLARVIGITPAKLCGHVARLIDAGKVRVVHGRRGSLPPVYAVAA